MNVLEKKLKLYKRLASDNFLYDDHFDYTSFYPAKLYDSCEIAKLWLECLRKSDEPDSLNISLYINIPFCRAKCLYCRYFSRTDVSAELLTKYTNYLVDTFSFFSQTFNGIEFNSLILGGGTASILNNLQILKLTNNINKYFTVKKNAIRNYEFSPVDILDYNKVLLVKKLGYNRINLGVQTFNEETLRSHNRVYINLNQVAKLNVYIKKINIYWFNIDLIAGLDNDNDDVFIKNFTRLAKLQIDSITVYNFKHQPRHLEDVSMREAILNSHFDRISRLQKSLMEIAISLGYTKSDMKAVMGQTFILKRSSPRLNFYTLGKSMPIYILGFGESAGSTITDAINYKHLNNNDYIFDPKKKIYKGVKWTLLDNIRQAVLAHIHSNGTIDLEEFKEQTGCDLLDVFKQEIDFLVSRNKIQITGNKLSFNLSNKIEKSTYDKFFYDENMLKNIVGEKYG